MHKSILYLISEDWYFWSHRLATARAAQRKGYQINIATVVNEHGEQIKREGFNLFPISMNRSGVNPFNDLLTIAELTKIYNKVKPDIVHHVALKPVIYGSIAAKISKVPAIVNTLTGLGHIFSANGPKVRTIRRIVEMGLYFALANNRSVTIFQNPDDMDLFVKKRLIKSSQAILIKGSGVDTSLFKSSDHEYRGKPLVLMLSRMLKTKGIDDFVKAADIIQSKGLSVRMVIAGKQDSKNPASLTDQELSQLKKSGVVEYLGYVEDIPSLLKQTTLVVLPSKYGEGIPKSLIEAASAAKAIISYDIPGCREIVRNSYNGILVKSGDINGLAEAVITLINDPVKIAKFGVNGRKLVEAEFSEKLILSKILDIYEHGFVSK
ncbi:MAG TPA: glycosyltransferase family 4 protein [Nitrospinota bacterium]|nr:glycosyltransferase family 4 protein [Nitrospinota bacterium]|tara:strand:+ start:12702 stop:13838 length:1137 start_codon:yes stop_codon:yes gene_type:complete